METHNDLAGEVFAVVGRFRRRLRRAVRPEGGSPFGSLTQSQVEMIRLVGRVPDVSVREAAEELGLAPNTASTLVSRLAADGHLTRSVDSGDRRVGRLRLTASAQRIADESRAARRAALAAALDRLTPADRADLARGLEVLSRMTRMLGEDLP